jgi:hypothetical protein
MRRELFSLVTASLIFGAGCTAADDCPANIESYTTYADEDGGLPSCAQSCPGGHRALYGCQFIAVDMAVRYAHVLCNFGPCPSLNGGGIAH